MKFRELKNFLVQEEKDASLERDGFISYLIPNNIVMLVLSPRDEQTWLRANYVQHLNAERDGEPEAVAIQLEGLPEDPFTCLLDGDIPVRFFVEQTDLHNVWKAVR